MGKDYDMKPWSLPGMYPELIDEFIKDWLRHFHDTHNQVTTAEQWALYKFIDAIKTKLGVADEE